MGNTVGVPNPRSDWNQTDPTKADYIKNKPDLNQKADKTYVDSMDTELLEFINEKAEKTVVANLREQISDKANVDYVDESVSRTYLDLDNKKVDQEYVVNMYADLEEQISDKVSKVEGKGLSANDFTNAYKTKLDNNTFDYVYRFENEERYLDEIFDDFTTNGLYKIYYSSMSDDESSHNIILSVTSAGVYGEEYEGEAVFQTIYDEGYIATRQRDVEGNWSGWSNASVSSSDVTKAINKAIGDVEKSLENIIEKYGLGGAK